MKLDHVLKTGDKVEIITAEDGRPQNEWLQFVTTHKAKSVISDYFKNERKQTSEFGRKMLEGQMEALGFKPEEVLLQRVQQAYDADSREDLFFKIGIGTISLTNLEEILRRSSGKKVSWLKKVLGMEGKAEPEAPHKNTDTVVIGGADGANLFIASCCNPIPGDPVIGFKAPDGSITIHKKSCSVAESIAAMHGDWVVVPKWTEQKEDKSFLVRISLRGLDRMGLLNEISRYLSVVMGVNMRGLNIRADGGVFEGYIDLYVNSRDILDKVIKKLSSIEGIENVSRTAL